ncbi:MAG: hypothetical protein JO358_07440 [Alphaproteobacteria bacterium]|nr:hypothetical protein [Alphaproteobacteria bacterium]
MAVKRHYDPDNVFCWPIPKVADRAVTRYALDVSRRPIKWLNCHGRRVRAPRPSATTSRCSLICRSTAVGAFPGSCFTTPESGASCVQVPAWSATLCGHGSPPNGS